MTENVLYLPGQLPTWTFAERLRKVRRDRNLTQGQFAEQLEVTESRYEAWETGRNKPADLVVIAETLEKVTGVPRSWFLGWMDQPTTPDGGESGRRDSNSQHSAWNMESSVIEFRPRAEAEPAAA